MAQKPKTVIVHLRLGQELHHKLQKAAEHGNRSMQAEIEDRLEQSFGDHLNPQVRNIMQQVATSAVTEAFKVVGYTPSEQKPEKK